MAERIFDSSFDPSPTLGWLVGCRRGRGIRSSEKTLSKSSQEQDRWRGMEKTHVAIVGMGTVGTGVARLLLDHGDRLARHAGRVLSWVLSWVLGVELGFGC